jgi:hypothetical protein
MTNRSRTFSRGARGGAVDVQRVVEQLARSIADIEVALRRAEGRIDADARERIQTLRSEARTQLMVMRGHQREASRLLRWLSTAAVGSWDDVKRAADGELAEARTVAAAMIERLRGAPGR